ncbi:zinc ABC transporter substrate-binding protein [Calothrix sp. FACHB-1219]|uniref:metal ABC transporter solute-binding protein, Zn/Mn family n=1 Tax=unclassified Calothrix TaxID=2619626 RepID=UPI001688DFDB|nr:MULTISPECIES: zinc ABC transporter substrate-binding protein [unclassified Calothrix]MBD2205056.1 zinc ABC transporter substrate-binding protein [Calothrix sp. FACHB-168]MBD2219854.1 zinc ABC transporter substrate-binding protein [Calothrix sp. FACHB-1219]
MLKKIRKINCLPAVIFTLTIGVVGCGNQATSTSFSQSTTRVNYNLPRVVATTSILCDLTKQIAQNTINLTCLIPPGTNPHLYQPKPEDRTVLEQANLILYNGYNLEPGLIKLIKSTDSPAAKIPVAQIAVPQPQKFRQGKNIAADPHIWHNVKYGIKMVEVISNNLTKIEPNNSQTYNSNKQKITAELTQLDKWIKTRIASIPEDKRILVTPHNAMSYYAKAYGLSLLGTLQGVSTNKTPTSIQIRNLAKKIKQEKVPTIFNETAINSNDIESVATAATVKVSESKLYTDGLGEGGTGVETYQTMITANTRTIVEGLGGTYLIFQPKTAN